jgi:hypothetical protein
MSARVHVKKKLKRSEGKKGQTFSIRLDEVQGHEPLANHTTMMSTGDKLLTYVTSFVEVDCIQPCQIVLQWYSFP